MQSSITVGYLNGDNQLDIIFTNQRSDCIVVLIGNGNGTFAPPITYSTGVYSRPSEVTVHDFTHDGHLDLAVANPWTNNIGIFLGIGDGTFQEQMVFLVEGNPCSIAVGDFNHDNQSDLAVIECGPGIIVSLLGNGYGTFRIHWTFSSDGCLELVVGDFNNDGVLDLAVSYDNTRNYVKVFFGNGDGAFSTQITLLFGQYSGPFKIVVNDFNRDNRLDLAVLDRGTNNIGIILGNGDGTFQTLTRYSTGGSSQPSSIVVGDFDNDHQPDLAVATHDTYTVSIFLGKGNGTFLERIIFSLGTGNHPDIIDVDDFNDDGKLDVITLNDYSSGLQILLNSCDCCMSG